MRPDIPNENSGGDLDEKIDFQSVMFFNFITHNFLSFGIEGLTYFGLCTFSVQQVLQKKFNEI